MFLKISNLNVHYTGQSNAAVDGVSFNLQEGEIGVLIGPSGCGKTTLLRAVAGLERASNGSITLGSQVISSAQPHIPAERRHLGMVFQDYALFPHLDIARNVAFGIAHLASAQREKRVAEVLELVGMPDAASGLRMSCLAASSSVWRWPGRSLPALNCCCLTSLFLTWM